MRRVIVGILFVLALTTILLVWNRDRNETPLSQVNVAIDGDPVIVASWQREKNQLVIVTIPASFASRAVGGLGTYPIRSLWQLGTIQGVSGLILSQSLEELLALPIPWYIGEIPADLAENVFSFESLPAMVTGRIRTNMPIMKFIALTWWRLFARSDRTIEIPLGASVTTQEPQPDGTIVPLVSTEAVDESLGDTFEEALVRAEKLTIAVYNTTATFGLGERAARIIDRMGGNVVRIGNEEATLERCQIRASGDNLATTTSRILAGIFGCDRISSVPDTYADVIVAVGSGYESRFVP